MQRDLYKRTLVGVLFPVFVVVGCLCTMSQRLVLPCWFRELTGLYCPGCGSGHALAATLRGNFREAFCWNPMVYLLGIPSMAILIYEYIRITVGIRRLKPVFLPGWLMRGAVILLVAFWILRNLPWFSFLAPGG